MSLQGGKCQFWVEKNAVEMVGEVRGANKVDPGPISHGPNAFWAELQLDSFSSLAKWECYYSQHFIVHWQKRQYPYFGQ
jgi:hypothetical protein